MRERVAFKDSLSVVSPATKGAATRLKGMAVKVCVACGKIIGDPYPMDQPPHEPAVWRPGGDVLPCHGVIREDYAPSVRVRKSETGELYAIAGEPMAHVRARAKPGA